MIIAGFSRKTDLGRVFQDGKGVRTSFGTIIYLFPENSGSKKEKKEPVLRAVFMIKKKFGNAVQRNCLKRIFREALRNAALAVNIDSDIDLVFLVRTDYANYSEITEELKDKLKLIKQERKPGNKRCSEKQ